MQLCNDAAIFANNSEYSTKNAVIEQSQYLSDKWKKTSKIASKIEVMKEQSQETGRISTTN